MSRSTQIGTYFNRIKKQGYRRIIAALLLSVIAIQVLGFFNIPEQTGNTGMAFELCTANAMVVMQDAPDSQTGSQQTPQRIQCAFCAMAHTIATPLIAAIFLLFAVLQTDIVQPLPYAFVLPALAIWRQFPARAPPVSFNSSVTARHQT